MHDRYRSWLTTMSIAVALLLAGLLLQTLTVEAKTTTEDTIQLRPMVLIFTIDRADYSLNQANQTMDVSPIAREGRTLLPIRYIADPLGARTDWNGAEGKVTITTTAKTIELWLNNNTALINGMPVQIDPNNPNVMPVVVPPGRTMMPLRFIADNLDCKVEWFAPTNSVMVSYPK